MKSFFHANTNGCKAETRLMEHGQHGSFLIRPSSNTPGNFALSVRKLKNVLHYPILNTEEGYIIMGESFSSIKQLVDFYSSSPNEQLDSTLGKIELISPLYCADTVQERWYHGGIDRDKAEILLKENDVDKTFLIRQSFSVPGQYVLSVMLNKMDIQHVQLHVKDSKYFIPGKGTPPNFENLSDLINFYQSYPLKTSCKTIILGEPLLTTRFLAGSIGDRIIQLSQIHITDEFDGFYKEFENLEKKEMLFTFSCNAGLFNREKNRYKNILPFDHTRIQLLDQPENDDGNKYINANYIDINKNGLMYIACQGPLVGTVVDMWRMIVQENVKIIICLTSMMENGKNKCFKYWNDIDEDFFLDLNINCQMEVKCLNEDKFNGFIVRSMELLLYSPSKENGKYVLKEKRQIKHLHLISWPDKSTLDNFDLLTGFLEHMELHCKNLDLYNSKKKENIIIHCSAGIGRTGTFIALHYLINEIKRSGLSLEMDIFNLVLEIRTFRSGMVQTMEQYKYIYLFISNYIQSFKKSLLNQQNATAVYGNINSDPNLQNIYISTNMI